MFCLFCIHRSPYWSIWSNYEVVECQPRSGIATVLEYVAIIKTILAYPDPPVSSAFLDFSISLLHPTAPPSSAIRHLVNSISVTPDPHILTQRGTSSTRTFPTPATCQHPPLVSAPRANCLCLRPFPASIRPPFAALVLCPGPCWPLKVLDVVGPSVSLVSHLPPPVLFSKSWHILVFGITIFGWPLCPKVKVLGASTPCQSLARSPHPTTTWPCRCHSGYQATQISPLRPPFTSWCHPRWMSQWGIVIVSSRKHAYFGHRRGCSDHKDKCL